MKKEILETALKQFLKYGIREMSIKKLIAPLGISTKTVYKYFSDKEKLLEEALHLYYNRQYELIRSLNENQNTVGVLFDIWYNGIERECKVSKSFFQDLHYYYPELEKRAEIAIGKKIWKPLVEIIKKGVKQGVFRNDLNPEVLLHGISVIYLAIARSGQFRNFRISTNVLFLNTIAIYIRGFCSEKGIEDLDEHLKAFKQFERINVTAS